jgi:hypothetical protein
MMDARFAVSGKTLSHRGQGMMIKAAGIRNDKPYAEVVPHDDRVVEILCRHIQSCIYNRGPLSICLEEVQKDLA